MKKLTGVYVNAENNSATPTTINHNLDAMYTLLDVSTIDIVSRKIGGKYYDIICDDEALLKDGLPLPSMVDSGFNIMLFGNLFVVSHDEEGNEVSLTQEDVSRILKAYKSFLTPIGVRNCLVGGY